MTPAPLDVRVARVVVPPLPFVAYFLLRVPQVSEGAYVPWAEAVPITLLVAVMVPLWLYWIADLIAWFRDRPAPVGEPSPLELTADLSDHGVFAGDLAALVDAEAHGRRVPSREYVPMSARRVWDELYGPCVDDRPTEPLLLTHEFTPASGIRMDVTTADGWSDIDWEEFGTTDGGVIHSWVPDDDGQTVVAVAENGHVYPVDRVDVVAGGRHRKRSIPIPPPTDENTQAYAFLNRTRELPFS